MTKPFAYQRIGAKQIWGKEGKDHFIPGRALLADDMGLGKTIQSLLAKKWFLKKQGPTIVVCPKSLTEQWQEEILLHINGSSVILEKRKPPRLPRTVSNRGVYIINDEVLGTSKGSVLTWNKWLRKQKPKLVIADEVQRYKSRSSKRTKHLRELCYKVPHFIALGGTGGIEKRPVELFPILNLIRPDKWSDFMKFAFAHCAPRKTHWGWEFKGAVDLRRLHKKMTKYCMIRRRKEEVLKDLPPKIVTVLPVEIEDRKQYLEAERDFSLWLRKTHPQRKKKSRKAERLVRMGYLLRLAAQLKMKAIKEWIDNFLEGEPGKLLCFGKHKFMVQGLHEHYGDICLKVDGSTSTKKKKGERKSERKRTFDRFNKKKKYRLFFGNLVAAGVGWSCKSTSNVAIFELDWKPATITQAIDRVHGVGRGEEGKGVNAYLLIAKGTIEEMLCEVLQNEQKVVDAVLDGKEVSTDMNIHDQLERKLMRKSR